MNIAQKVSFQPQFRNIIMGLIYLAFTGYSVYQMAITPQLEGKIAYLIVIVVILGIALWSEYLRHLYQKAIIILNKDGNPEEAKKTFDGLLKKDIFRGYRKTVLIFDTLYYADQMDAQGCLDTLEKDHKFFHSCMDNLLIWDYTKFYAYFLMNNRTKTKAQYERVIKLKDVKAKLHRNFSGQIKSATISQVPSGKYYGRSRPAAFCAVWGGRPKGEPPLADFKLHAARVRVCVGLAALAGVRCGIGGQPVLEVGVVCEYRSAAFSCDDSK